MKLNKKEMKKQTKEGLLRMTETEADSSETYEGGEKSDLQHSASQLARKNTDIKGLEMLEEHHEIFEPLTSRTAIDTVDKFGNHVGVISMIISYDSKYLVALCSGNDESFSIMGFSLTTHKRVFCNYYEGEYMKVNVIE